MTTYTSTIYIKSPIERVFHFHNDTQNLLKITPPNISVTIETVGSPGLGYEVVLKIRQFGLFTMRWLVRITEYEAPYRMVDEQIMGPFAFWRQTREFRAVDVCLSSATNEGAPRGRILVGLYGLHALARIGNDRLDLCQILGLITALDHRLNDRLNAQHHG